LQGAVAWAVAKALLAAFDVNGIAAVAHVCTRLCIPQCGVQRNPPGVMFSSRGLRAWGSLPMHGVSRSTTAEPHTSVVVWPLAGQMADGMHAAAHLPECPWQRILLLVTYGGQLSVCIIRLRTVRRASVQL
jgi:hypothetical protein